MSDFLTRRDGVWHFARRVPAEFAQLDPRGIIKQSTKIKISDDPKKTRARVVANRMNEVLEAFWQGLVEGKGAEAQERYDRLRGHARAMGITYRPAVELAEPEFRAELVERLEKLEKLGAASPGQRNELIRATVLGGEDLPKIMLSELFVKFEAQVKAEMTDMSPDQIRKWRNPKIRAVTNLLKVTGDLAITDLKANHGLDFSEWWQARVIDEEMNPGTANKDMGHLARMLSKVSKRYRLGIPKLFEGMKLEGAIENSRPPFDTDYIQQRLLAEGALAGMNDEARGVVFLMMDAGLRPSEACNLNRSTIILDADIPYVKVLPDGRRMKTVQSRRDVPLVGTSLAAMRKHPDGFPRYHDDSADLSATVNKYLGEHNLRQDGTRTLYSLRHSFKDRLITLREQDSMIDALMGHKEDGSKYGTGPTLAMKRDVLQRIAFTPPATL